MVTSENVVVWNMKTHKWTKGCILSLKLNKSPGYDDISFYVIKNCFELLHNSYFLLLTYLLNRVAFLSTILNIKLLKKKDLGSYRLVSVLIGFPKILK